MNTTIALLTGWNLTKYNGCFYLSGTHYTYLEFISTRYDKIYLISSVSSVLNERNSKEIAFSNIEVVELPYSGSFLKAQKNIIKYYKVIKSIAHKTDLFYCRVPDPFSWMPKLIFNKKTIMHFVGDSIEATKYNEKWSWFKKKIMIAGYYPDYLLTILAAKKSKVYTNGSHIANRLKKYSVKATPVVSSTISEKIFNDDLPDLNVPEFPIHIIYVGYIRFAKGIHCLMQLCKKMQNAGIDFVFDVIGSGEMFEELKSFVINNQLDDKVILHGHIDNKAKLLEMMRNSHLFFFPSLSEGSPRVVIEAMSQGIPVISTPVGSLPETFEDKKEICFFNSNDFEAAFNIIKSFSVKRDLFIKIRDAAYKKVKHNYSIEAFLGQIF